MGLFSGKKKTYVATSVSRVISDKMLPNAVRTGTLRAIVQDDEIPANILEQLVSSIGVRAERMYEYAERSYTFGVPSGQFHSATQGNKEAQVILSNLEGTPVLIDYCQYGPPNNLHIAWSKLVSIYGYNPNTNEITSLSVVKKNKVYLQDIRITVSQEFMDTMEPGALVQWGIPAKAGFTPNRPLADEGVTALLEHTPVYVDPAASVPYAQIAYCWIVEGSLISGPDILPGPEFKTETLNIPLTGFDDEKDYFHVKYFVNEIIKYWMYEDNSGVYPDLDNTFDDPSKVTGDFFPFAYFRYNKQSVIENKDTEEYKTSKKLVKYLGMDYDDVASAVDENPDIKDVEQAMLVFAVPANSSSPIEQRYLYEFFDNWFYSGAEQFSTPTQAAIEAHFVGNLDIVKQTIVIQDKRFKMALSNGGIYKKRRVGKIGVKGSYEVEVITSNIMEEYMLMGMTDTMNTKQIPIKTHCYRYQISENLYDEIKVVNLKMMYYIFEKYTTTGDDVDAILLIPLARTITTNYSSIDREELYSRALHYVFNSRVIVTIKWYQSDFFQFLLLVVAVVMTVISLGTDGGALITAIASGNVAAIGAAAYLLLEKILIGLVIGAVVKVFIKAVGLDIAFILAVILAVVGMGTDFFTTGSGVPGAPWAQDLLSIANTLVKGITDSINDLMNDLLADASAFNAQMEEQFKLIDDANKLLETSNILNPRIIFGESPNDFYNRTVHSGNIGVMAISAVSSFVDIALTLPKLEDTLGEE